MQAQTIDYEALAKQHGAIGYTPATKTAPKGKLDYAALAKQHGAISSQPASQPVSGGVTTGTTSAPPEDFIHSLASTLGIPTSLPEAKQAVTSQAQHVAHVATEGGNPFNPFSLMMPTAMESAPQIAAGAKKTGREVSEAAKALTQGDVYSATGHTLGAVGYGASTLLTPVGGGAMQKAGEQFGAGNVQGGAGTTLGLIAPVAIGGRLLEGKTPSPAMEVLPRHVEALTGLIEDRGGIVDPHATATEALPHLRETAVRMKVDPSTLKGREAGQATLKVAEQAVRDTQNEFNEIRKPYNPVLVDQSPMAQAYLDSITPELLQNEPRIAMSLMRQADKFAQLARGPKGELLPQIVGPKTAPLEQVNQFRIRMNNQLNAFEQRGTTAQIMSDIESKASHAAANAARDIEYQTVGRLSGLDPAYVRALKQREGALIEAKSSLTKEYNRASGAQGEAVSKSLREKAASTYPSKWGVGHTAIKNIIGPKPIDVLNSRIQKMFADMGTASELPSYEEVQPLAASATEAAPPAEGGPSGPVPAGEAPRGIKPPQQRTFLRTTQADVKDYYNYRFDQLREEMKSAATPEAKADVQRRMNELDVTQRSHPTSEGGVSPIKPPVAAGGHITPEHVAAENAFYTQARAELGAAAEPSAVLRRAQQLKIEHAAKGAPPPVTPANPPKPASQTLTQKMAARSLPKLRRVAAPASAESSQMSPRERATALMLLVKSGQLSPAEADSKLQRLIGPAARRTIRRPVGPE